MKKIEEMFQEHNTVIENTYKLFKQEIFEISDVIFQAFTRNSKLFIFGNGGSAADSQHIAAEFINKFKYRRKALPALALTTDTSILTSITNDVDYSKIFVRQLEALSSPGDVALGISTSGQSLNVFFGLKYAKEKNIHTIGLFGETTSSIQKYCDHSIKIPSSNTPRIQECHMFIYHVICELVEEKFK